MPTMIRNVKGSELSPYLLRQAKISPDCFVTITVEEEEKPRDLKQELREALQEVRDYEAGKIELQTYDSLIEEIENETI